MYAEVVVNLLNRKLDRVFHYSIPSALEKRLREGMQVLVPFGPQTVDGYVVGLTETAEVEKTRDVLEIVEEEPVFSREMLALARWMSKTYLCTMVDALHVVMPPGLKLRSKKFLSLNNPDADLKNKIFAKIMTGADTELKDKVAAVLELLSVRGKAEIKSLEQQYGKKPVEYLARILKENGWGEVNTRFAAKARKKKVKQVMLPENERDDIEELIHNLALKAPKQAEVLKILASDSPVTLPELKEMGCSPTAVHALQEKGLIKIEEIEDIRDPFQECRPVEYEPPKQLTSEQAEVLADISCSIERGTSDVFLLHGATGSGKTEVYLQAIDKALIMGKQAIFLVPEIALTPQMVQRVRGRFGEKVAVLHSALSLGERFDQWRQIKEGAVQVVVGARSAVFAPVPKLGLIIVDEEHESTYKQEENPKYHAREVAIYRSRMAGCPVILGSATPSVESYYLAREGKYKLKTMPNRIGNRPMPEVHIVDLRREMEQGNRSIFSSRLQEEIAAVLQKKEQIILFLNRRGYSTFVVCRDCGFVVKCRYCNISLTYHAHGEKMICHYCGYKAKVPQVCPVCRSKHIRYFGLGTQRVEDEIKKLFPQARVLRMDVDTTSRKGAHEKILTDFAAGKADILIGTQMIAKGLDFPKVTLVGVISADTSLNLPDFRAAERTFQLLTQVAGRAGRAGAPGKVIVQTYAPAHYSVRTAQKHDFPGFYGIEIETRREMEYPPFSRLLRIVISGFDENKVIRAAHILAENVQAQLRGVEERLEQPLLGPAPAPLTKLRNKYRWQLCIKAKNRKVFGPLVDSALYKSGLREQFNDLKFNVEIDPQSLL
ncbi:primosomal protein N' [Thermincola potens]|uniref:Replication restart protein PriA n=1 Tax=Thermincola potens (strain JR) TaxID=635013 RepID=D5X7S7_THEPJ|nr:primosomal protein N' [Thermincola potens]ADG82647.1 primosomal protein N' [Thermincola potens JR]